jgi:hypothetical protein
MTEVNLEQRTWGGPAAAPWESLRVADLPPLRGGFSAIVEAVSRPGPLQPGERVALFPLLERRDVTKLLRHEATVLAMAPIEPKTAAFEAVQSAETDSGVLTILRHLGDGEPSIVDVHSVFADGRAAGGGLVFRAPYPFRYVATPPEAQPVPTWLYSTAAALGFLAGVIQGAKR